MGTFPTTRSLSHTAYFWLPFKHWTFIKKTNLITASICNKYLNKNPAFRLHSVFMFLMVTGINGNCLYVCTLHFMYAPCILGMHPAFYVCTMHFMYAHCILCMHPAFYVCTMHFMNAPSIYVCTLHFMYAPCILCMHHAFCVCTLHFMYASCILCMHHAFYVCTMHFIYAPCILESLIDYISPKNALIPNLFNLKY
jgi:hypothetical protein